MNLKVDPSIQGIPQDAVHKDQGRMTQIEELVDKLRIEYQTESIIADLGKKGKSNKLSDESRRTLQKIGNIELYELGEMSKTTQCRACLKYAPEGLIYCPCGVCLMPSQEQRKIITIQFEVIFCSILHREG